MDASPKASTHRNLEPDPIYPLSTLLVRVGVWQRPCHLPEATRQTIPVSGFLGNSLEQRGAPELSGSHAVHLRYIRPSAAADNRSLPVGQTFLSVPGFKFSTVRRPTRRLAGMFVLRQSFYQFIHLFRRIVEMRRDSQPITAWCGDDVSFLQMRVKFH